MNFKPLLAGIAVGLLAACQPAPTATPQPTAISATATLTPTIGATATPVTPTATQPTPTIVTDPTLRPTTTPTPPFAIGSTAGQWLVTLTITLHDAESIFYDVRYSGTVFATVEGSGLISGTVSFSALPNIPGCAAILMEDDSSTIEADLGGMIRQGTRNGKPQIYADIVFKPRPSVGNQRFQVVCASDPDRPEERLDLLWRILARSNALSLSVPLTYGTFETYYIDLNATSGGTQSGTAYIDYTLSR